MNDSEITSRPLGPWLEELASSAPAPGGGAAAALNVAVGAALVEMVCNLTIGKPRYAEHEATMTSALARAGEVRGRALALAAEDAEAFAGVSAAYGLPRDTDEDKAARTAAIQEALVGAADVPLRTAGAAAEVIDLCDEILDGSNVNVISDVAVAASSARAGLESAAVNVEINLVALKDEATREKLAADLAGFTARAEDATRVMGDVSRRIRK